MYECVLSVFILYDFGISDSLASGSTFVPVLVPVLVFKKAAVVLFEYCYNDCTFQWWTLL